MANPNDEIMTIHAWNPVWRAGAVKADTEALMPSFLFKSNIALLDVLQQSQVPNRIIEIDITGTNSLYDGIQKVIIDRSNIYGGDRPNYFATKNLYIATLINRDWFAYPPVNGVFKLRTGILNSYQTNQVPEERQVRIVNPNVSEGFEHDNKPYMINTIPSIGAIANAAYNAAIEQAKTYGDPISYVYGNPKESFACDRCGPSQATTPLAAGNFAYDSDASMERFQEDPRSSPKQKTEDKYAMSLFYGFLFLAFVYIILRVSHD